MSSRLLISLWQILNERKHEKYINWDASGDSFTITDMYHFNSHVLPYLDCPSFVDFTKKLSFIGFQVDGAQFSHEKFHQGRSDLLSSLLTDCLKIDEIHSSYQPAVPNDPAKRNKVDEPNFGSHRKFEVQQNVAELRVASKHLMDAVARLKQGQNDNQKLLSQTLKALQNQRTQQKTLGDHINKIYPNICKGPCSSSPEPVHKSPKEAEMDSSSSSDNLMRMNQNANLLEPPRFVPQACQLKRQTGHQQMINIVPDPQLDIPSSCPETKFSGKRASREVKITSEPKKFSNSFGGVDSKKVGCEYSHPSSVGPRSFSEPSVTSSQIVLNLTGSPIEDHRVTTPSSCALSGNESFQGEIIHKNPEESEHTDNIFLFNQE